MCCSESDLEGALDQVQNYSFEGTNLAANTLRTYKSDVPDFRRSCQGLRLIREATHELISREKSVTILTNVIPQGNIPAPTLDQSYRPVDSL
jgi:hypothetical protein